MNPKQDNNGFWIYDQLPPGIRLAAVNDFYNKEDQFYTGLAFLIQSYYSHKFECYRTISKSSFKNLGAWIQDGRVYVWDG